MAKAREILGDKLFEEYGREFTEDVIEKIVDAKLQEMGNAIFKDVRKVERKSVVEALRSRFEKEFPGASFEASNADRGFCDWLDQSGNRAALDKAFHSGNVDGCLAVFRAYANTPPEQRPDNVRAANREAMRQAADFQYGQSGGNRGQGKIWTRAEIQAQYKQWALHPPKTQREEAEREAIERDISNAARENRIR